MRIEKELEKTGFFWLPGHENDQKPGILKIKNGGRVELEIVGNFDEDFEFFDKNWNIARIVGFVEGDGNITLERCFYTSKNLSFGGISKSKLFVSMLLIGASWEKDEEVTFSTFSFSVDCMDEWVGISGINVKFDHKKKSATINYTPPENISILLNNQFKLEICFEWGLSNSSNISEQKITQRVYFKLSSEKTVPLQNFLDVAFKITNLMSFAIHDTVAMKDLIATSPDIKIKISEEKNRLVPIKLYYQSNSFLEIEPQKSQHEMLFSYDAISSNADKVFNNWINAHEHLSPAIGLYFSTKTEAYKYIDGKFLALAQGLETYHRRTTDEKLMKTSEYGLLTRQIINNCPEGYQDWLSARLQHGNEISLSKRLKAMVEPFKKHLGTGAERKKLLRKIVVTRNYLTHYSPDLEKEARKGRDLWVICQKMDVIICLHFLMVIGFTDEEIGSIINKSHILQQKLRAA